MFPRDRRLSTAFLLAQRIASPGATPKAFSMKKRQPVKMGGPMGGGMGAGEKAKDFKGTVKKLAKYLVEFRWQMLMVAIFAVGSTMFAIASPKILGGATNQSSGPVVT